MRIALIAVAILGTVCAQWSAGTPACSAESALGLVTRAEASITRRSSSLATTRDGSRVFVVSTETNSLVEVNARNLKVVGSIKVGRLPQSIAIDEHRGLAFVANQDDDTVSIVRISTDEATMRLVGHLPVGRMPYGVVVDQDGRLFVSNTASNTIQVFSPQFATTAKIQVSPGPRGLVLTSNDRLLVSHLKDGRLTIIAAQSLAIQRTIAGFVEGGLLQGFDVDASGDTAYLPQTFVYPNNDQFAFDKAVAPVVVSVDLRNEDRGLHRVLFLDELYKPVNLPLDAIFVPARLHIYVCNAGTDDITIVDQRAGHAVANLKVGRNPRGMALSADEARIYVDNALDGSISVIDTSRVEKVADVVIAEIDQKSDIVRGKILFNSALLSSVSRGEWISCATCHFGEGSDGRAWKFKSGLRKTPALFGIKETPPYHWKGDFKTLYDVDRTIREVQGGTGLRHAQSLNDRNPISSDLQDLVAFLESIEFRRAPSNDSSAFPAQELLSGRSAFFDRETGCSGCHPPPLFTDLKLHDVGTGGLIDTPSLRLAWEARSYLHDGRAASVEEVLSKFNPQDRHGTTSPLDERGRGNLAAFVRTIETESKAADSEQQSPINGRK